MYFVFEETVPTKTAPAQASRPYKLNFTGEIIIDDEVTSIANALAWEGFKSTLNNTAIVGFCDGSATENSTSPNAPGAYAVVTTCFAPGLEQDGELIQFCYQVEAPYAKAAVMEASGVLHTVKFSWVQFRVRYKATPPELRPSHATIMVFFDCQAVQDNLRKGKYARERLSWHVVYNQVLAEIAQLSQDIAHNDLGVAMKLELRWIKGHAKVVSAHNRVHKLAYAARTDGSKASMGGNPMPVMMGVLDGRLKTLLDELYASSTLPEDNQKRKAALVEDTADPRPAKKRRRHKAPRHPAPGSIVSAELPVRASRPPVSSAVMPH